MTTRRLLATFALVLSPVMLAGCSGAEVQDFFTSHGHAIPQDLADRLATVITRFESPRPGGRKHCEPPESTAPAAPAAPAAPSAVSGSDACPPHEAHRSSTH